MHNLKISGLIIRSLEIAIAEAKRTYLICTIYDIPVATVMLDHKGLRTASAAYLFVRVDHRGKGIGGLLIKLCCAAAIESKCESLTVQIESENAQVIGFYRKQGFIPAITFADGNMLWTTPLVDPTK